MGRVEPPRVEPLPRPPATSSATSATPSAAPAAPAATWALRILATVALLFLLREAQPLLVPVAVAIVLTFVLAPLVRALRRVGIPEVAGAAIVVCALLLATVPLAASLAQPAAQWWERAPQTLAQLAARLDALRASVPGLAPPHAPPPPATTARGSRNAPPPAPPPPPADPVKDRIASESVALTGALLSRSASMAFSATATVILLYFLLASEHWMLTRCIEAVPRRRQRALVLGGVRAAQRAIGRFLAALGFINAGVGLATGLALWWIGLPNPTLWGVLVAVLNFVPYLGPLVIVALLALAGLFAGSGDFAAMLAPPLAFLAIHAVEANLISPWIVGRHLALSPVSVFLSVMVWGWLWGIAGALIAVPLLIGVREVCRRRASLRLLCRFLDGDSKPPPTLRALLAARRPWRRPARAASEAVNVADARQVGVLPHVAREAEPVPRPFHDQA